MSASFTQVRSRFTKDCECLLNSRLMDTSIVSERIYTSKAILKMTPCHIAHSRLHAYLTKLAMVITGSCNTLPIKMKADPLTQLNSVAVILYSYNKKLIIDNR